MTTIHRSVFLKELKDQYPELSDRLNSDQNMFERDVLVYLEFVQQHIDDGDRENTRIHLSRLARYYSDGNNALKEFIRNGVCEDMKFENTSEIERSCALDFLPRSLRDEREAWVDQMGSWARK